MSLQPRYVIKSTGVPVAKVSIQFVISAEDLAIALATWNTDVEDIATTSRTTVEKALRSRLHVKGRDGFDWGFEDVDEENRDEVLAAARERIAVLFPEFTKEVTS